MAKFKEILKNIVIVLLLCSIFCLILLALPDSTVSGLPLPDGLRHSLGLRPTEETATALQQDIPAAASPLAISVRNSSGRCTFRRSSDALQSAYSTLSPYFGQALVSAQQAEPVTMEDFTAALRASGFLFSFGGRIPTQALSLWLTDREPGVLLSASDFLLVQEGSGVSLLVLADKPLRCATSVSAEALLAAAEAFRPDGSALAAEAAPHIHPLTLMDTHLQLPTYTVTNPVTPEFTTLLASALDFNPYGSGNYTDPSGTTVFTESNWSLSVATDGRITIAVTGEGVRRFTAATRTDAAKIELARSLLETITRGTLGDQELQLLSFEEDVCSFTYVLDGVPVLPAVGRVSFREEQMTELTITLRTFHLGADTVPLLPLSAAVSLAGEGQRLFPAYSLSGTCGWIAGS